MDLFVVCLVAFLASGLTLFSGFGLGTLLLPAFLLFFPAEVAVAMTAIVHFFNNIFKLAVLGKHADLKTVIRFGTPAVVAAAGGAALLFVFSDARPLVSYEILGRDAYITPIKVVMGVLIITFAAAELMPSFEHLAFERKYLPLGGLLSGFFGGLSGHQGALRSAFLVRAGLSKEGFIATGVVIACLVDVTRLAMYVNHLKTPELRQNLFLLVSATVSAFLGVVLGNMLRKKITMRTIQVIVSLLLFVIAIGLGAGLI